jgi:hypothetical protein
LSEPGMRTRTVVRSVGEVLAVKLLAPYHVCYASAGQRTPKLARVVGSTV